jgi:UDP-glucose:(heptosyl)LPS alpha-1,3-glucosyltransferase
VARLGVQRFVHFLGFQPDVAALFRASDFFALPSYYDPCSLVVFEALTCGLPVVTTRQNGAGELISAGREGFVVESPDSIAELGAALEALCDPAGRAAMSAHAARLGRQQTFERHMQQLLRLFEAVAVAKAASRVPVAHALPRDRAPVERFS